MIGCGHCDRFKPAWTEITKKIDQDDSELGGLKVKYYEFERKMTDLSNEDIDKSTLSSEQKRVLKKYKDKANGFPTILVEVDDKILDYDGNRSVDDVIGFIKKSASQSGGGGIDYRKKYKHYKKVSADLVKKYKAIAKK